MRRVRVEWNGLGGLPGLSTFYYGVASPNVSDLVTFFTAIKGLFPSGVSWTIPSGGDEINDADGKLTGSWVGSGGGTVVGSGGNIPYAAGTGAIVNWYTGVVVNGRRVQGRTFLAPLTYDSYDASGTIDNTKRGTLTSAVNAWVASGVAKGIWHRPNDNGPGLYAAINAGLVPDRVTSLRSRRY